MLLWKLRETCYAYNLVCIVCSWSPSHALNLPEEVPNPDALYSSLDMLTDDLPPATQNDSHSAATRGLCCLSLSVFLFQQFTGPLCCCDLSLFSCLLP